jgi:hypothetical protein
VTCRDCQAWKTYIIMGCLKTNENADRAREVFIRSKKKLSPDTVIQWRCCWCRQMKESSSRFSIYGNTIVSNSFLDMLKDDSTTILFFNWTVHLFHSVPIICDCSNAIFPGWWIRLLRSPNVSCIAHGLFFGALWETRCTAKELIRCIRSKYWSLQ